LAQKHFTLTFYVYLLCNKVWIRQFSGRGTTWKRKLNTCNKI